MTYEVFRRLSDDTVMGAKEILRDLSEQEELWMEKLVRPGDKPANLIPYKTKITHEGVISAITAVAIPPLRAAVQATLLQLDGWSEGLTRVAGHYQATDVQIGQTFLAQAGRGLRLVVLSTSWNTTQKIAFCGALSQGASDVRSPDEFFSVIEAGTSFTAPTNPTIWASPDNGQRWLLAEAVTRTTNISNRFASAPTTLVEYADMSWVATLNV